jgi:serine/threonine-protein kinase
MPITSVIDLVEEVLRLQVLTGPQRTELQSELAPRLAEPRALAADLIKRGWLTPYQVNHIIPGHSNELILGPYVLMERIGEGGMGEVYKALHTVLRRIDAVKVMHSGGQRHGDSLPRFFLEAIAAGKVDHRNLVAVRTADRAGDCVYLAMEYIDGADLGRLVQSSPNGLPISQACDYIRQTALGLQHAHEKGLVHRDIKPSNLMVTREGVVKVLDLGLARVQESDQVGARLTRPDAVMGTPDYMSPEQINSSSNVDARSDIYSLGCTLHHLLTGQPPYAGGGTMDKLRKHCDSEAPSMRSHRPDIPEQLDAIVRRMMARDPAQRFQSAGEIVRALGPFCELPLAVSLVEPLPASVPNIEPLPVAQASVPTSQHADTLPSIHSVPVAVPNPVMVEPIEPQRKRPPGRRKLLVIGGAAAGLVLVVLLVKLLTGGKKTDDSGGTGDKGKPKTSKPTLVVDPNGELKTIHDAINKAEPGMRIHIRPGLYREQLTITIKDLELVGDGPVAEIVIQGTAGDCLTAMTDNLVVKGLTIRGKQGAFSNYHAVRVSKGHLLLEDCVLTCESPYCVAIFGDSGLRATLRKCKVDGQGRVGVQVREQAEVLIEDCDLRGRMRAALEMLSECIVTCRGGSIHDGEQAGAIVTGPSRLTLEKVEVTKNGKSGVQVSKQGKAVLKGCIIHDNRAAGVLIEENHGSLLEECDIHGNVEAGVKITQGSTPTLRTCHFRDGSIGLLCDRNGIGFIEECTFTNHRTAEVQIIGGNPTLKKCVIKKGKGVKIGEHGNATLRDCTITEHAGHGVTIEGDGKLTVRGGEITKNGKNGMSFEDESEGDVEGCDLRNNSDGAFSIGLTTKVTKKNNKE